MKFIGSYLSVIFLSHSTSSADEFSKKKLVHFPLIPKRSLLEERRYLATDEEHIDHLHWGIGTHYVDLWVGCPPQRQTVIVDTGSHLSGFPCSGCVDCGSGFHVSRFYQEHDSSCYSAIPCGRCDHSEACVGGGGCPLSAHYAEGSSWAGAECADVVYAGGSTLAGAAVGDEAPFPFRFACKARLTGLFRTQLADGIMGLDKSPGSFWRQMHAAGVIADRKFSLCYSLEQWERNQRAGAMVFGGTDDRLHGTPMIYAEEDGPRDSGWYYVTINRIYLRVGGGESIASNHSRATVTEVNMERQFRPIIDSGTTITYLPSALKGAFVEAWSNIVGVTFSKGRRFTAEEYKSLPTIIFQLAGSNTANVGHNSSSPGLASTLDPANGHDILVAFPPSRYLEFYDGYYAFALNFEPGLGVLGANFIAGHDVLFDIDNGQIGFAESRCDYQLSGNGTAGDLPDDYERREHPFGYEPDATPPPLPMEEVTGDGRATSTLPSLVVVAYLVGSVVVLLLR